MFVQKTSAKPKTREGQLTFQELYDEISRDRDLKASRLQERRWNKINHYYGLI